MEPELTVGALVGMASAKNRDLEAMLQEVMDGTYKAVGCWWFSVVNAISWFGHNWFISLGFMDVYGIPWYTYIYYPNLSYTSWGL